MTSILVKVIFFLHLVSKDKALLFFNLSLLTPNYHLYYVAININFHRPNKKII